MKNFGLFKAVKTKRLVLRILNLNDYAAWFDAYVNGKPAQNKWDRIPFPAKQCSKAVFKKLLRDYRGLAKRDDYYRIYAVEKKTGAIVGLVDIDIFVRQDVQMANFGYRVFNRHWGKGYGQEIAKTGLKIGFGQLKLNRLEAAITTDNRKSIRLAKAIGMRKEGLRKNYWLEDGKWVDHVIYAANPQDVGLQPAR
jgi:ribosomal-protein-alanine N-acetyltransferase